MNDKIDDQNTKIVELKSPRHERDRCIEIISKGVRKGEQCKTKKAKGSEYCRFHIKDARKKFFRGRDLDKEIGNEINKKVAEQIVENSGFVPTTIRIARKALEWIEKYIDQHPDGLVESDKDHPANIRELKLVIEMLRDLLVAFAEKTEKEQYHSLNVIFSYEGDPRKPEEDRQKTITVTPILSLSDKIKEVISDIERLDYADKIATISELKNSLNKIIPE